MIVTVDDDLPEWLFLEDRESGKAVDSTASDLLLRKRPGDVLRMKEETTLEIDP